MIEFPKLSLKLSPGQIVVVKIKWSIQNAIVTMDQRWAAKSRGNGLVD
jgi:hypothetical protein